jgi:uncharacterized protein (TIGR02598 family)
VEVTLAIGIVAFAFVALFALIPVGLTTFRQAMDTSVGAQIAQRIVSDAQQTDFDALVPTGINPTPEGVELGGAEGQFYSLPIRMFDDQGTEVLSSDLTKTIYMARVRGSLPGSANVDQHKTTRFTSLPSDQGKRYNPRETTFLTVQVIYNPARKALTSGALIDSETFLISPEEARKQSLPVQTFSAVVTRNGYQRKL